MSRMVKSKTPKLKKTKSTPKKKKVGFTIESSLQSSQELDAVQKAEDDIEKVFEDGVDESDISIDEENHEVTNEKGHQKLLKSFGVEEKKKKIKEKVHPTDLSEKDFGGKLTVSDILAAAPKSSSLRSVEKILQTVKSKDIKTLDEPLPRHQREQAEREVNYEKTKKEVTKWQPIVKRNREAEHMAFPLCHSQATRIKEDVTAFATKRTKPSNDLEAEVFAVLEEEKHVLERPDHFLTEAEEKTLEKLNAEEAEERRLELSKMRALLSYQEEKFRRKKKIKSKKYHKLLKKDRQKEDEKNLKDNLQDNAEGLADETEKADYLRALERMSQKHKVGGKWNKNILHKNIKDPELKKALSEQRQIRAKLMEKKEAASGSEDEEDTNVIPTENPSLPQEEKEEETFEVDPNNPWLVVGGALTAQGELPTQAVEEQVDESNEENESGSGSEDGDENEGSKIVREDDPEKVDQEALIDMAFANDDVIAQFAEEKEKIVDEETEKDVDLTLPGWGAWGGVGVTNKKPQKRIIKKAPPQAPRKDAKLNHVIINTKKNRKLEQHLVKRLPYPYKTSTVFVREIRQPIGPQWNSVRAFRNMIKPEISTVDGKVIDPIAAPKGFDNVKIKRRKR